MCLAIEPRVVSGDGQRRHQNAENEGLEAKPVRKSTSAVPRQALGQLSLNAVASRAAVAPTARLTATPKRPKEPAAMRSSALDRISRKLSALEIFHLTYSEVRDSESRSATIHEVRQLLEFH